VTAGWQEPGDEAVNMMWVRQFYQDLFADTGGVPIPNDVTSGASINHPDRDLADPDWNTSDCAWYTMYYRGNYPRLQGLKLRWDPRDVFHHALSIRPTPSTTAEDIQG
jgi:aclacinomycin oxidase